jgi:hypothetical protein
MCVCVCVCVFPPSSVSSFLHFWRWRRQGEDVVFACLPSFLLLFCFQACVCVFPSPVTCFLHFLHFWRWRRLGEEVVFSCQPSPSFFFYFLLWRLLFCVRACACAFFLPRLRVFFISGGEEDKDRTCCFVVAVKLLEGFLTVESGIWLFLLSCIR